MNCTVCGKSFPAQRSTARYCGGACRVKAHRLRNPVTPPEPVTFKKLRLAEELVPLAVKHLYERRTAQSREWKAAANAGRVLLELRASIESQGLDWWTWWEATSLPAFGSRKDVERLLVQAATQ
jgi:hypothetical protein